MPASISLIRHAEKQVDDGPPYGVLVDGTHDSASLTPRGWQRAGALVGLFLPRANESAGTLVPTPTRLFATEVGRHSHSRRPSETLEPLSERLGLPLEEPFLQDELDQIVEALLASEGHVLVAWEHKRIPLIARRLVDESVIMPEIWPDDRFDVVWVFEADPTSAALRFRQVPQMLLAGDRADPIPAGAASA